MRVVDALVLQYVGGGGGVHVDVVGVLITCLQGPML